MTLRPGRLIGGGVAGWVAALAASLLFVGGVPTAHTQTPSGAERLTSTAHGATHVAQRATAEGEVPAHIGQRPAPAGEHATADDHRPTPEYVGSAACARCHQDQYDSWRKTLHLQMTKPIAEATVVGDFRPGTHLEANGRAYKMETRGGRYYITVTRGTNPPQTFEVNFTLGARRFQGYLSKLPDGRIYVLPAFWHNENKRWIDWKEITPIPDMPDHDLRQIWNVDCVNCHATNLVKNYDVATNSYNTTWTEMGIGCEACHGPGAQHIARMDEWAKNPASKPAYDPGTRNGELSATLKIFSPKSANPRQVFDTCGYCHGNKSNRFFGFRPGEKYEDYALPFLISEPIPPNDPQGDFWTDGRPSRFNRPQAITLTGCFMRGQITCTKCHTMHGSRNEHALKVPVTANGKTTRQSDALCTQCHGARAEATATEGPSESAGTTEPHATAYGATAVPPIPIPNLQAHTHHAPDSPGSRCVECHMSDVNWRLFTRRRDHTFQPPVPEMTMRFGVGNACNTCHDDKTPEWAAKTMDEWYGNGAKRQAIVQMADVFYRAGAGDTSALPEVVRYAVDRKRGALIRASAAEFAGQLLARIADDHAKSSGSRREPAADIASRVPHSGSGDDRPPDVQRAASEAQGSTANALRPAPDAQRPAPDAQRSTRTDAAIVNALAGAAADPEPMVRAAAVRALANTEAPQKVTLIAAHLRDDARVVRAAGAEGLFANGIVRLDGPAGPALVAAQSDWMASLRTFNDLAPDHVALGWLDAEVGNVEEGVKELESAIRLDAHVAEPYVYLGVIAAREGRFTDALARFKSAKSIDPSYANLDRLLEEVRKRLKPSGH